MRHTQKFLGLELTPASAHRTEVCLFLFCFVLGFLGGWLGFFCLFFLHRDILYLCMQHISIILSLARRGSAKFMIVVASSPTLCKSNVKRYV